MSMIQPQQKSLHLLMIGKGGAGKSSLANAILDSDVCSIAERRASTTHQYTQQQGNTMVHVYDTRGLLDGDEDIGDMIKDIEKVKPDCLFDICVVCIKFNDRFDMANSMIFNVVSRLNHGIWPKVYVALTNADIIPADWPRHEINTKFTNVAKEWRAVITKHLREKMHIKDEVLVYPTSHTQVKPPNEICLLQKWLLKFTLLGIGCKCITQGHTSGVQLVMVNPSSRVTAIIEEAVKDVADIDLKKPHSIADMVAFFSSHEEQEVLRKKIEKLIPIESEDIPFPWYQLIIVLGVLLALYLTYKRPYLVSGTAVVSSGVLLSAMLYRQKIMQYIGGKVVAAAVGLAVVADSVVAGMLASDYLGSTVVGVGVGVVGGVCALGAMWHLYRKR